MEVQQDATIQRSLPTELNLVCCPQELSSEGHFRVCPGPGPSAPVSPSTRAMASRAQTRGCGGGNTRGYPCAQLQDSSELCCLGPGPTTAKSNGDHCKGWRTPKNKASAGRQLTPGDTAEEKVGVT